MCKTQTAQRSFTLFFVTLLSCLCFLDSGPVYAGEIHRKKNDPDLTVRGTVKDAVNGKSLAGASITLKGTNTVSLTDLNGAFSITVPDANSVLVVSYVGYVSQEVLVGNNSTIDVSLQPGASDLGEVVVVGYGTQSKKDVTGSVKTLKSGEFNKGIINSPQQLLQGKVAGVNVTSATGEPGGALSITIRGPGSVRSGSTPLFVVDGLPLDNASTGGGDPLNFINPEDIESFDVLKDASATAIYGSRGANGVVIITTKKGKAGTSLLTLSANVGVSNLANKIPVFSADEFRREVVRVGGQLDDKGGSTDWQDLVTRTALTQNYNVTLSGGAEKLVYYASFGAQRQEGIIRNNSLDRYTGRFNATQKFLDDRLVVEANLSVGHTKNVRPPITSIIGEALGNNPTYPAYDANGNPAIYQNVLNNPLIYFDLDKDVGTINRFIGSISPSFKIIKGLVYKLNFGIDNSNGIRDIQALGSATPPRDGRLDTYQNYNRNTLIENYLTYNWVKAQHNVSALAGHSFQKFNIQGRNFSISKIPVGGVEPIYNPGVGTELTLANNRPGGYATVNEQQSYFGRVTYQYNNKYLATVNFRADGSSKFGENNKYGYFPSFSLGWKISDEDFMKNSSIFSNLKLRGGWGKTGNQEIESKITQPLFISTSGSYPLYPSGTYPVSYIYRRLANPDIQWEVSKQTDIGLDFGLLKGELTGTIDYFNKKSTNILLLVTPADPVQPSSEVWTNVKDMVITNQGVEVDLNYRKKINKDLSFGIGGNITFINNDIKNSPYTIIPSGSAQGSGLTSATLNGYINGQPIGTFFLLQYTGIGPDSLSAYLDADKNGSISNDKDRVAAGTALPDKIYSFYGNLNFKGFDLAINFNGVAGNKIYDNTANSLFYKAKLAKSTNTTSEASLNLNESNNNPASISTRYLKNGSYLRLNNLSLGYNFNTKALGISRWASSIRLSVTGQNLFVITDYDGYDPEVNIDRNISGALSYGIDYLSYPKARSFIFGVNVSF
ncbi:SusC/RagA family TonB-linked outer membrane protein [Terrimonas alba]|uniref:SusC/RagA family TonB-linked outer membrane protein n=1 Tax=Terrimonas alba TaxID=3349636 RepID=UPI0035F39046